MKASPLDAETIARHLRRCERPAALDFSFFETLTSTNDEARRRLLQRPRELLVLARRQTDGRGRHDHRWESYLADNIYLSFGLPVLPAADDLRRLPMAYAAAIVRALESRAGLRLSLKFPNDLLLNGAKVGGILTETVRRCDSFVLGIGLNLHHDGELQRRCDQPITSLSTARRLGPNWTVLLLVEVFFDCYDRLTCGQPTEQIAGLKSRPEPPASEVAFPPDPDGTKPNFNWPDRAALESRPSPGFPWSRRD